MRNVSIVGKGATRFGSLDSGPKDLAIRAVARALDDSGVSTDGVDALYLGNFVSGILDGQETLAPLVADGVGLNGIETMKTEGACASSGIAFRKAFEAVRHGIHDVVVAVGVEQMTSADTAEFTRALNSAADNETEGRTGLTFPGFYGLVYDRYVHEYGATQEQIAAVSVKNRENGVENPRARFRNPVTIEEVSKSELIADPLRLYDCCPAADGSTALVLTASSLGESITDRPIHVLGSGHASGRSGAYRYDDLTTLEATSAAAEQAYGEADLGPDDIGVVELHDCFSIAEIADSEDLGFFQKGEGARAAAEGLTQVDGKIPINPSGGLLAKGHPVGATGIGQLYELCLQLEGDHENQVPDAEIGLAHNLGGSGAVSTVTILGGIDE